MSRRLKKTHLFSKDVAALMYAYGDAPQPLPESVQCVDELVSAYLVDICMSAYKTAQTVHRNKIKVEDFKFVLRNDAIKLGRANELIKLNKIITESKKLFNSSEGKSLKRGRNGEARFHDDDANDEAEDTQGNLPQDNEKSRKQKEPARKKKKKGNAGD